MPTLIRILLLLFLIYLVRWYFAKHKKSQKASGTGANAGNNASQMVKDPICGMYMDARLAVRFEKRNEAFYFCSEECKNKYLGNSAKETGTSSAPPA